MAKLSKTSKFSAATSDSETPMEKTSRVVRELATGDAEKRTAKMARLRKARLEKDAAKPD